MLFFLQKDYTMVKLEFEEKKQLHKQIQLTHNLSRNINLNIAAIIDESKNYMKHDFLYFFYKDKNKYEYLLEKLYIKNYYKCCSYFFKVMIYKKTEINKFMKNYSDEKINYNFAVRDLSSVRISNNNNQLLLMLNLDGKSKNLEKKILFDFVENMNELTKKNYIKDTKNFFSTADIFSQKINKQIKTWNNKNEILIDEKKTGIKTYNYIYSFEDKINIIKNINYDFNENFYKISETLFNQKKYITSKLFILMFSTLIAFCYILIIFLIGSLNKENV